MRGEHKPHSSSQDAEMIRAFVNAAFERGVPGYRADYILDCLRRLAGLQASTDYWRERAESLEEQLEDEMNANERVRDERDRLFEQLEASRDALRELWDWVGTDRHFSPLDVERKVVAVLGSNPASEPDA